MKLNYAKALLELRSKLNISQTEMAALLNVSYPSVNRWENGRAVPIKIARVRIEKMCKENNIEIEEVAE
ncbi:MAG: helix-turn-helix domain-containing protein [Bacilli bacterium]|nr:helix-turn-helix domain-containing protein [Bacilli bacterium]